MSSYRMKLSPGNVYVQTICDRVELDFHRHETGVELEGSITLTGQQALELGGQLALAGRRLVTPEVVADYLDTSGLTDTTRWDHGEVTANPHDGVTLDIDMNHYQGGQLQVTHNLTHAAARSLLRALHCAVTHLDHRKDQP
ncbi:hypothetical protein CPHO_08500 [Corynebacterium phocae]|uniref:Uncharacterized protein n=1 Tax=Corynebacterium phocae TaxID=161895 RepID=A0A1L7D465_9CORY|nr:hypothetical protein [Corynebacterium phocae]APT92918.1 hypothetical protein CPHO_08500 [Corynebacterium phocae]KAA8723248.1 hypothetical protein F4V58_08000 [Corynebacterium phocae]